MRLAPGFPITLCSIGTLALGAVLYSATVRADEPAAKVVLNDDLVGVFFNDGDSFRILKGRNKGGKARLAGFNTLESHGAVHQWGDWTARELYYVAKMATLNARVGSWTCNTDGDTDTYGRMLVFCDGLATDQIRQGFAHAMTVTDEPSKPEFIEAQAEAMREGRGIWAHGTPDYVLTSIHSVEEDIEGRGTYNRVVSSKDGHSIKWKHSNRYSECENVCLQVYPEEESVLPAVAAKLKSEAAEWVSGVSDEDLMSALKTFQRIRLTDREIPSEHREKVQELLTSYADQGLFGQGQPQDGACMIHVPFERRFGGTRAACLKK